MKTPRKSASGSRHQPEQTRQAILDAAEREFARRGLAGARTETIACAAGVNKALLYYYFDDKEGLYRAVIERVFAGLRSAIEAALERAPRPSDKILAYAGAHFDYIVGRSRFAPRLIVSRLLHETQSGSERVRKLCAAHLTPIFSRMVRLLAEGVESGEFRPVDPRQFLLSIVAIIVFYFAASPMLKEIGGFDPLSPGRLAARRAAVLDFISTALFRSGPPAARPRRPRQGVRP
jgi:TetR/AcrR family transcriptional regulator